MANEWIDVSVPVRNGMVHWPGDTPFERKMNSEIAKGDLANVSQMTGSVHTGTHMDAPLHFIAKGRSIDAMPISATVGPARVIAIEDPKAIRIAELEPHKIARGERILFRTTNSGRVWNTDAFQQDYVYVAAETAEYLASIEVQVVGVDYLSVGGFQSGNPETHRALLGAGIWVIEGLDLQHVEPGDFEMICLPLKLVGSDGAPARAVLRKV
jgi:arylformamidase